MLLKIDDLKPDKENCRLHPEKNLIAIRESIKKFGQYSPLIVQKSTNKILVGNARFDVLQKLGYKEVECNVIDLSDEDAKTLAIVDNRTSDMAEWNYEMLVEQLRELGEADAGLDDLLESLDFDIDKLIPKTDSDKDSLNSDLFGDLEGSFDNVDEDKIKCPYCKKEFKKEIK